MNGLDWYDWEGWDDATIWVAIWNAMDRLWPNGVPDTQGDWEAGDHPRDEFELAEWARANHEAWKKLQAELTVTLPPLPNFDLEEVRR